MSSKSCSSEPKQGGDGAVLGDQPFQNSASAITISSPLACRSEGSLYKVEVVVPHQPSAVAQRVEENPVPADGKYNLPKQNISQKFEFRREMYRFTEEEQKQIRGILSEKIKDVSGRKITANR